MRPFWAGVLLVLCPPVGIWACYRVFRPSPRPGEATESITRMLTATDIAPGSIAEPRRPREREPWTRLEDYWGRMGMLP
jgi:hypothetical protein